MNSCLAIISHMQLTRREWASLIAGAAAPLAAQQRKIGYCIVGLGRISMQHFMPALKSSAKARLVALVSGHRDKAEKQAAEYGVPAKNIYRYDKYDAIAGTTAIADGNKALPTSLH